MNNNNTNTNNNNNNEDTDSIFNYDNSNNIRIGNKALCLDNNVCFNFLSSSSNKVVNLSSFSFDPPVFRLMEKGLNVSLAPRKILVDNIICDIEYGIKELPDVTKDIIHQDCTIILIKAKAPKNNINKPEFDALKSLNNSKSIVDFKVEKGVVILDKDDYCRKMLDHLHNSGSYRKLNKDPLKKISKSVVFAIKASSSVRSFSHKLIESFPHTPRIYGLPKIHKEGAPLRPIVNTIGGPTYLLAKYLAQKLKPLAGHTKSFAKDSTSFVNELKNFKLDPDNKLVSFNVVSLYTNIPISEAIKVIKHLMDPDTANLVSICLTSTFFSFDGEFYEKTCGVAMGPPSPLW